MSPLPGIRRKPVLLSMNSFEPDKRSFWDHADVLRRIAIWCAGSWFVATSILFSVSDAAIDYAARHAGSLIFLSPVEAFALRLHVAMLLGVLAALPVVIFSLIKFAGEGLNNNERRVFVGMCFAMSALFGAGAVFADRVVVPVSIKFLLSFGSETLRPMLTAGLYLSFYSSVVLFCGVCFNLPLGLIVLGRLGIVSHGFLACYRRHVLVGSLIVSAILTPPDVITQIFLAGPVYMLYEAGLWGVRIWGKTRGAL